MRTLNPAPPANLELTVLRIADVFVPDTCTPQCAEMFEEMYAECHPRFEQMGMLPMMKMLLGQCQGFTGGMGGMGGGHRRQLSETEAEEASSFL